MKTTNDAFQKGYFLTWHEIQKKIQVCGFFFGGVGKLLCWQRVAPGVGENVFFVFVSVRQLVRSWQDLAPAVGESEMSRAGDRCQWSVRSLVSVQCAGRRTLSGRPDVRWALFCIS